jgi:hypothetical protein
MIERGNIPQKAFSVLACVAREAGEEFLSAMEKRGD